VCTGSSFKISGNAVYDIGSTTKYVVKGGDIRIELSGPGITGSIIYGSKKTNIFGHYSVAMQAPTIVGTYSARVTATDMTCNSEPMTVYFNLIDDCNQPPPPVPVGPIGAGSGGGGIGDGWACGPNECIWTPGPGTGPR
jgi:hypothetical protein